LLSDKKLLIFSVHPTGTASGTKLKDRKGKVNEINKKDLETKMKKYLMESKSKNTVKKYNSAFNKWRKFAKGIGAEVTPAKEKDVALFITRLIEEDRSWNVIYPVVYAIKFENEVNGHKLDTTHPYIKGIMEAAKRKTKVKVNRKDPITTDIMVEVCEKLKNSTSIIDLRDLTLMAVSYAGFLRFDEAVSLKRKDVKFESSHVELFIEKSKTDQFREGNKVLVARGETPACPVKLMKRYLERIEADQDFYIFRPAYKGSSTNLIKKNKKLSYTRARECIKRKLQLVGKAKSLNIGTHSFRAGGATTAANNQADERLLQKHGRWSSATSKNRYIKDSVTRSLEVSRLLKL